MRFCCCPVLRQADVHLSLIHDAVRLYVDGLNDALGAGVAANDTRQIATYLRNNTFTG